MQARVEERKNLKTCSCRVVDEGPIVFRFFFFTRLIIAVAAQCTRPHTLSRAASAKTDKRGNAAFETMRSCEQCEELPYYSLSTSYKYFCRMGALSRPQKSQPFAFVKLQASRARQKLGVVGGEVGRPQLWAGGGLERRRARAGWERHLPWLPGPGDWDLGPAPGPQGRGPGRLAPGAGRGGGPAVHSWSNINISVSI
jgi:hypothetical protein